MSLCWRHPDFGKCGAGELLDLAGAVADQLVNESGTDLWPWTEKPSTIRSNVECVTVRIPASIGMSGSGDCAETAPVVSTAALRTMVARIRLVIVRTDLPLIEPS